MELKTDERVREAYDEASDYARELYPEGTIIDVRLRRDWRVDRCEIWSEHYGTFRVRSLITEKIHNFYPGIQPHAIIDPEASDEVSKV